MNGIFNLDGVGKGKSHQDIIDEMTIDECIDGIKHLDICCNRAEIVREKAIQALQEKLERDNPKPLGLEELEEMVGEPVWVESMQEWRTVCIGCENDVRLYSIFKTISAKHVINNDGRIYRHKPNSDHIGGTNEMLEPEWKKRMMRDFTEGE